MANAHKIQTEGDGILQNTKTKYSSDQRTPVALLEIEQLLPPLSAEQFSSLESDILENGCYAPIIVNENVVIIDGHNHFHICEKHGLSYQMLVVSFSDLIVQLTVGVPLSLKKALGNEKVSINRGWKILKAVQQLPLMEQ